MSILPKIIQGGMGVAVSNWRLSQAVSRLGQLGVVSGTALDQILCRRLQDGDPEGHVRRALAHFPFPRMVQNTLDKYFVPGGKPADVPYKLTGMHAQEGRTLMQELCILGNYVEVFLAREGHSNPVGINYLEKIQLPHLPSLYGAMLAGVAVVIVGAGIPIDFPNAIAALAQHQPATYGLRVVGSLSGEESCVRFDPIEYHERELPPLTPPQFYPIVSSDVLAAKLSRKSPPGSINGFVIEGPLAGGHNAPPRGAMKLNAEGSPIYGPRDSVDLEVMRKLGIPFWLAGGYGSPESLKEALSQGAAGVQVGTAFALCVESGITAELRHKLINKALTGQAKVFTDPLASPAGFPFKVAELEGTLSQKDVYAKRKRVCDLGFLREAYRKDDGSVGFRCAAENEEVFVSKGGLLQDTIGRKCICNALIANAGMPQLLADGTVEKPLITLGDDFAHVGRFCSLEKPDFTAADVIRTILG